MYWLEAGNDSSIDTIAAGQLGGSVRAFGRVQSLRKWECGLAHCKILVVYKKTNVFSHTSGGQKSKIWAG